jgi:hypothetical protein
MKKQGKLKKNKERRLEILAVVITGLLKFVFMDWLGFRLFYIVAACLFWVVYIYSKTGNNPEAFKSWGFQRENFRSSFLVLLPVALLAITGILIYGALSQARFLNWHIIPILLLYPAWGTIQQFMMVGLIAGNLRKLTDIKITESQIILFTSFLFAFVHYPSFPLMGYAFIMEVIFIKVYLKWPNIWSLGLYHGLVSGLFIFFVLGRDLWSELWKMFV